MGPMPASSPGLLARSVRVGGMVRVTRPANPGGITPAGGPAGAGAAGAAGAAVAVAVPAGRAARAAGQGPGIDAEQDVEVSAGAQLVHVPVQPGLA